MSFLTDIAVVTIGGEDQAVAFVNARLAEGPTRPQQLGKTDLEEAGAGGRKVCSIVVYAACFNYLDFGDFEEAVRAAPWRLPGCTVVYVDGEGFPDTFVFSPARAGHWEPGGRDLPRSALVRLAGQQPRRATRAQRRGPGVRTRRQHLTLNTSFDPPLWTCSGCGSGLVNGILAHHDSCTEVR